MSNRQDICQAVRDVIIGVPDRENIREAVAADEMTWALAQMTPAQRVLHVERSRKLLQAATEYAAALEAVEAIEGATRSAERYEKAGVARASIAERHRHARITALLAKSKSGCWTPRDEAEFRRLQRDRDDGAT